MPYKVDVYSRDGSQIRVVVPTMTHVTDIVIDAAKLINHIDSITILSSDYQDYLNKGFHAPSSPGKQVG